MARRSVQWRQEFSFPGDPPTPAARGSVADDRRALPPRRHPARENRLAPRAGEEDFRWLQASMPGSPESGSGTPSPQLWAQHPHYDRLYPASAGSSPSRAQAIAGYRREMLDLVRGLPEAAYELSLRDIVESRGPSPLPPPPPPPQTQPHAAAAMQGREDDEPKKHVAAPAMPMDDEQAKKQSGGKKQRKQRTMGRTRSRSMERSVSLDTGLLIKLFMPLSVGRKKKVLPKPAAPSGAAKEGRKKKMKQGKNKVKEEEWWKKSEFSEAGSSSRTSSTGSSNSSASRNGNGHANGAGSNPQAPARSRSRKKIGCYGFFKPNKGTHGISEE